MTEYVDELIVANEDLHIDFQYIDCMKDSITVYWQEHNNSFTRREWIRNYRSKVCKFIVNNLI